MMCSRVVEDWVSREEEAVECKGETTEEKDQEKSGAVY